MARHRRTRQTHVVKRVALAGLLLLGAFGVLIVVHAVP